VVTAGVDPVRLRQHVELLAEPRSRRHAADGMARAEAYVAGCLERAGWRVTRRTFPVPGAVAANLLAERPGGGTGPVHLVGAHLDTVPGSPGADDNASGVACLLELARILPARNVLLAVFDEEETGLIGAEVLAGELAAERPLAGVVVYECVGFYPAEPGTQTLPPGAALIYPRQVRRMRRRAFRGEWTLLAYRRSARPLVRRLEAALVSLGGPDTVMLARDPLDMPVLGPVLRGYPPLSRHFARSDHRPFWDRGIPAVQVTDTANFRNPHYHRPTDTPDTLDYTRMADLVTATAAILTEGQPADR
jgi:Zn-dependent M28 family amino/carboxypeptidase